MERVSTCFLAHRLKESPARASLHFFIVWLSSGSGYNSIISQFPNLCVLGLSLLCHSCSCTVRNTYIPQLLIFTGYELFYFFFNSNIMPPILCNPLYWALAVLWISLSSLPHNAPLSPPLHMAKSKICRLCALYIILYIGVLTLRACVLWYMLYFICVKWICRVSAWICRGERSGSWENERLL